VRAVVFPHSKSVLSASRDATVRLWKLLSSSPPAYDATLTTHGSAFVNSLTYLKPRPDYPEGLIISGGKDTFIEVRQPSKKPEEDAEALLIGHSNNVCSLDVDLEGKWVLSGGWDNQARVWRVGKWECETVLEGHEGNVWAVLAYDGDTIITGCADKLIRLFTFTGKLIRTIRGSTDVVRALCRISKGHSSGGHFASAGNDGIIRLWTIEGRQVGEMLGHENFIYALASTPSGEIISSGEDRTVRIWQGNECIQTITHPAISVWSVAVCAENGDIVSGASDRIVRVFSRAKDRQAEAEAVKQFEDSVKSSSIPQQQVGEVSKEKLPGPEFLQQKSGTKEGQVQMIRESNGSVTAHQWSQSTQSWISVGTVVDAVGSSGKRVDYLGEQYDYVFDVDIAEGRPPLKLPYNLSQNPYEAATKFLQGNEISMNYLDQTADFITKNVQGATIGQASQTHSSGSDPWGTGSRYVPGEGSGSSAPSSAPASRPKVIPQSSYLSIKTANLKTIQAKIVGINQQLIADGLKEHSLNPTELDSLHFIVQQLGLSAAAAAKPSTAMTNGLNLVLKMVTDWPSAQRLPGFDLLRLLTAAFPTAATYRNSNGETIVGILEGSGVFQDRDRSNNIMMAVRALANLFESEGGRTLAESEYDKIYSLTRPSSQATNNRNLTVAVTTLYINYAVLFTSSSSSSLAASSDRALTLLQELTTLISSTSDAETVYRALVAAGTLLTLGEEVLMAAKEIFDLGAAMKQAEQATKEPRIKGVAAEIRKLLE
ncbi:MAG: hypothetical protein M1835_004103, partial [Candelina submexicana]